MTKPFRAILLAAGLGTRLRPITLHTPKCLVDVHGEPLLARWLRTLEDAGCESVLVNTHYLSDQVKHFLDSWKTSGMSINISHEKELLGTAGTLIKKISFLSTQTSLLIHSDNFMVESLDLLLKAHDSRSPGCDLTMMTFDTDTPRSCGIVTTDEKGVVTDFFEKVQNPPGKVANAALYVMSPEFLSEVSSSFSSASDFSTEIIPYFKDRIQTYHTLDPYLDIGTPESLFKARQFYSSSS